MRRACAARALAACALSALVVPAHVDAQAPATIRVTFVPVADAVPIKYALREGLFEKAGLNVELTAVGSGALATVAVVGGAADIGSANTLSITLARSKGVPLMLVAPQAQYDDRVPTTALLVTTNSPIATPKQLEGHTVAVAGLHDLLALGVRAWMARGGADFTKVSFLEMPQSTMLAALDARRVDAIMVSEPVLTATLASGRARQLAGPYGAIGKRFIVDNYFATATWLGSHRDLALRFADVMRRATAFTNGHYDQILPLIASYTSIDPSVLRAMRQIKGAAALTPDEIQPIIDVAAKYGEIPGAFPAQEMIFTAQTRF